MRPPQSPTCPSPKQSPIQSNRHRQAVLCNEASRSYCTEQVTVKGLAQETIMSCDFACRAASAQWPRSNSDLANGAPQFASDMWRTRCKPARLRGRYVPPGSFPGPGPVRYSFLHHPSIHHRRQSSSAHPSSPPVLLLSCLFFVAPITLLSASDCDFHICSQ